MEFTQAFCFHVMAQFNGDHIHWELLYSDVFRFGFTF